MDAKLTLGGCSAGICGELGMIRTRVCAKCRPATNGGRRIDPVLAWSAGRSRNGKLVIGMHFGIYPLGTFDTLDFGVGHLGFDMIRST